MRVGYLPDALPFAFFNEAGDLVGFDIELAHRLAREMGVSVAFVPIDRDKLAEQLAEGYCDLVMSGVVVTTNWAREVLFSDSYLDETLAFVVPDDQRESYASWDAIRDRGPVTIAVPDVPYYVLKLRELLPRAVIQVHAAGIEPLFDRATTHADALALPAERGSAWTLIHPAYSVVVPGPRPDPRAARVPDRQTRRAVRELRQYLDRAEAEGRHDRRGVQVLDSRTGCRAAPAALVDRPQRSPLDGVTA